MKREIEFRGLTHDTKEWKYGYYAKTKLTEETISLGDARIHDIIIENGTMWHITGGTQGQYTGSKCIDGNRIYEGDLIRVELDPVFNEEPFIGIVTFLDGRYFIFNEKRQLVEDVFNKVPTHKVLGNIHTHPHLLEAN
ncbi:YopX family protein [Alkalihalobacillus sp. NPDC078783]